MAYCHIAHNCIVGNRVILSNNASLAGHVTVGDYAIIAGMTGVHQFVRIGCYAMVGGMSGVSHDISPYTIGAGNPFKFGGLNIIGLKRHGFSLTTRQELFKMFKLLYRSQFRLEEALERVEKEVKQIPEVVHWLDFCRNTKRGLIGLQGIAQSAECNTVEEEKEESESTTPSLCR
jgi:UDP-N-acetylglucosamine acyltransferase